MRYAVVIEKTGTGYSAYVPDLPGCVSVGRTREEMDRNIREAISLYLDELREQRAAIPISPEQEHKLSQLATRQGRDADALAQEAIGRYLEEEARFIEALKLGEETLDRGEYLTHEEVGKRPVPSCKS